MEYWECIVVVCFLFLIEWLVCCMCVKFYIVDFDIIGVGFFECVNIVISF